MNLELGCRPGPTDPGAVLSPLRLRAPAPWSYPSPQEPYSPSSQPAFLGLIRQKPRQLLALQTLVPDAPPVMGGQTRLSPSGVPWLRGLPGFLTARKAMKRALKESICLKGKQMPDRCAPNPHYSHLIAGVGTGSVLVQSGQRFIKHSRPEAKRCGQRHRDFRTKQMKQAWGSIPASRLSAVWPWVCHLTSLNLHFLSCRRRVIRPVLQDLLIYNKDLA